jgi:hypothetical protein
MHPHPLSLLIPVAPILPDPEPPFIQVVYDYQQLKEYRLQSQPYIVRANYDVVHTMIEDGILERRMRDYMDWLSWVRANL